MSMVIDVHSEEFDGGKFVLLPEGRHIFRMFDFELVDREYTNKKTKKREQAKVLKGVFECLDREYATDAKRPLVREDFFITEAALWRLANLLRTILEPGQKVDVEDEESLVDAFTGRTGTGVPFVCEIKHEAYDYKKKDGKRAQGTSAKFAIGGEGAGCSRVTAEDEVMLTELYGPNMCPPYPEEEDNDVEFETAKGDDLGSIGDDDIPF